MNWQEICWDHFKTKQSALRDTCEAAMDRTLLACKVSTSCINRVQTNTTILLAKFLYNHISYGAPLETCVLTCIAIFLWKRKCKMLAKIGANIHVKMQVKKFVNMDVNTGWSKVNDTKICDNISG